MKNQLRLVLVLLVSSYSFAQVTWTGQGSDIDWNIPENWDSNNVPGLVDDVIIPDGFSVRLNTPGGEVQSLDLQGTSTLTMVGFALTVANTFTIDTGAGLQWFGPITGGGTVTNDGVITLGNSNGTLSALSGAVSLNNNGTINLSGTGDIGIATGCSLNNNTSGTINITGTASGIARVGAAPNSFNNSGLLKIDTPTPTDINITAQVLNNNGTIEVETGVLNLDSDNLGSVLTDGIYNIFPGSRLNLLDATELAGTLTGANNGILNLPGTLTVPVAATLNIGGSGIILFDPSINGGGILTNQSVLTMQNLPALIQDATLLNQNLIELTGTGDLSIVTGSTVNNDVSGTIDLVADTASILASGGAPNTFLNSGLLKTSFTGNGSETSQITVGLINSGIIEVNNGRLRLMNNNVELNGGTYNIAVDGILDWENIVTVSGSLIGNIAGVLNWKGVVNVPLAAALDFGGLGIVTWFSGDVRGGGKLANNIILNKGNNNTFLRDNSTLNNNNTINFNGGGDLIIEEGSTLNNNLLATMNFLADDANIGVIGIPPRTFNNNGDIIVDLPDPTDEVTFLSEFNNNNANIEIQSGILQLNNTTVNSQTLFDGVYNVFTDGAFDWDGNVTVSGELTGNLIGPINWNGGVWVNVATTGTFFFSGNKRIAWNTGSLNGGGTLINRSNIDITAFGSLPINGATTLNNGGDITFTNFGDLGLTANTTLNNLVEGTIEMQVPASNIFASGPGPQNFNNLGLFTVDTGGINVVSVETTNSGLIDIRSGELEFNDATLFTNDINGIVKGTGTLDIPVPANFTNDGTISPGNSPGILPVFGDYSSTSSAKLEIEIDGLNQGADFDFIPITGDDVVFDGLVEVILGFDPNISDEFVIATTSGSIITCNLQSPVMATFNGTDYEFDVVCRNNNEVVLTVTDALSVDSFDISDSDFSIYPNPADGYVYIKNSGQIELTCVSVHDLNGRTLLEIALNSFDEDQQINLRQLSSGVYFMQIQSATDAIVKRLVIK